MIEIKIIDSAHKQDIRIPNEPFRLWGRMIPSYENETWHYTVEEYALQDTSEMCFPDEDYDYDGLSKDHVFVGAYDGDAIQLGEVGVYIFLVREVVEVKRRL